MLANKMRAPAASSRIAATRRVPLVTRAMATSTASLSVEQLDKTFGIAGSVQVASGTSGSTKVVLKHGSGTSAEVYLFGACVTSWKQASEDEVLYVRPDAVFDKSKPISGGIPLCFPQFGPGQMQQHGFARNLEWGIASTSANPNPDLPDPTVELVLTESDYTLKMWPFKFKAVYTVALHGEELRTEFRVINTDDKPFDFTAALHTYIEVLHVGQAKVKGLKGLTYLDKSADPKNPANKVESRDLVTFGTALVDSVYLNAPEHVELDVGTGAAVAIDSAGWTDAVVWNPHLTMKDSYERFVCVEQAKVGQAVVLKPGESWSGKANFSVVELSA